MKHYRTMADLATAFYRRDANGRSGDYAMSTVNSFGCRTLVYGGACLLEEIVPGLYIIPAHDITGTGPQLLVGTVLELARRDGYQTIRRTRYHPTINQRGPAGGVPILDHFLLDGPLYFPRREQDDYSNYAYVAISKDVDPQAHLRRIYDHGFVSFSCSFYYGDPLEAQPCDIATLVDPETETVRNHLDYLGAPVVSRQYTYGGSLMFQASREVNRGRPWRNIIPPEPAPVPEEYRLFSFGQRFILFRWEDACWQLLNATECDAILHDLDIEAAGRTTLSG